MLRLGGKFLTMFVHKKKILSARYNDILCAGCAASIKFFLPYKRFLCHSGTNVPKGGIM